MCTCQIDLVHRFHGKFSWEWMVFKSNYPLTSLSRQKIHIIRRCIPCQTMNWTWSGNRNFQKFAKNSDKLSAKLIFFPAGKQADVMAAISRKHVNTSCYCYRKVSVRHRLKPHILIAKLCTYIFVQESQRFWDFVRLYTYESTKGLRGHTVSVSQCNGGVRFSGRKRSTLLAQRGVSIFWEKRYITLELPLTPITCAYMR